MHYCNNFKGNSGAEVSLVNKSGVSVIEKKVYSGKERFKRDVYKQKSFSESSFIEGVYSPQVLSFIDIDGYCKVSMRFCEGVSGDGYLLGSWISDIGLLRNRLNEYFNFIFNEEVRLEKISTKIFKEKIESCLECDFARENNSIYNKLLKNDSLNVFADKFIYVPCGFCHGDLTLSNIIFTPKGEICLIDFLDTYLESPLQDLVKIYQDIDQCWSFRFMSKAEKFRAGILMKHIETDKMVFFKKKYLNIFRVMEIINVMRIAPYIKDDSTASWVTNQLIGLSHA